MTAPFCVNCRHFEKGDDALPNWCKRAINVVTGETELVSCTRMRAVDQVLIVSGDTIVGACGLSAKLYEHGAENPDAA